MLRTKLSLRIWVLFLHFIVSYNTNCIREKTDDLNILKCKYKAGKVDCICQHDFQKKKDNDLYFIEITEGD